MSTVFIQDCIEACRSLLLTNEVHNCCASVQKLSITVLLFYWLMEFGIFVSVK